MKQYIISALLLLLIGAGCTREEMLDVRNGSFDFLVNATLEDLPDEADTKATGEVVIRLKWSSGDRISVINATKGKVLGGQLTAQATGSTVPFSGTLTGTISQGDKLIFLYPAMTNPSEETFTYTDVDFSQQNKDFRICVYAEQTAGSSDAEFANISLSFKYLMGFVRANMTDMPVSSNVTKFVFNNWKDVLRVSVSGGEIATESRSSAGAVTYSAAGLTTNTSGTLTLYLALPPADAVASRTVSAYIGPTVYTTSFTNTYIVRGDNLNTRVAGFVKSNIVFADETVRNYCLTYFDKDGDGEISFIEAATPSSLTVATKAVTSLPANIRSFTEMAFFTGLTSIPSFSGYTSLESIAIPAQITEIPNNCFNGCTSLMNVVLNSTVPPTLGSNVFVNNYSSLRIYVPGSAVSTYRNASGWSSFSSIIKDVTELGTGYNVGDWNGGGTIGGSI